jgi:RNA polymerase sigma-70 factor (ECF subfamily)
MHQEALADQFERLRPRLMALAFRMLGSSADAADAVQEAWFRLSRADVRSIENVEGWLRTVVSRLCLDALRTRKSRREEPLDAAPPRSQDLDPEQDAVLIDSVGRAMLVVMEALTPAERIAFVLHDFFSVPFDQIAPIVNRTPVATKKLASRARHRVRGATTLSNSELARRRRVVDAFLTASRTGDLNGLLAVLAPNVVRRADAIALSAGKESVVRGADAVARETLVFGRRARFAEPALVNGTVGVVVAPGGRLTLALAIIVEDDRIVEYDVIADPTRLEQLHIAVLGAGRDTNDTRDL